MTQQSAAVTTVMDRQPASCRVYMTQNKLPKRAYLQNVVWEAGHDVLDDVIRLLIPGAVIGQDHKISLHEESRLSSEDAASRIQGLRAGRSGRHASSA